VCCKSVPKCGVDLECARGYAAICAKLTKFMEDNAVSDTEREYWNNKADKTYVDTIAESVSEISGDGDNSIKK